MRRRGTTAAAILCLVPTTALASMGSGGAPAAPLTVNLSKTRP